MIINGTGILEVDSEKFNSIIIIDLKSGLIRVQTKIAKALNNRFPDIFDQKISIKSFEAIIREGKLKAKNIKGLFIKNYNQSHNILDSIPLRSFKFLDKYNGNELILKLKNSRLPLQFEPFNINREFTEFHFLNVSFSTEFNFNYDKTTSSASLNSGHAIIKCDKELRQEKREEFSDIFMIGCCLGQGGYSSVREIITPSDFIINLVGYDIAKPPFKLIPKNKFKDLLNAIIDSYSKLPEKELKLLKNAIYYLNGGYNQDVHLEFRIISLFTSIEILDNSKRIDKNILKKQFELKSLFDAVFLKEIRNQLIHNGSSIQKAISTAIKKNSENDKGESEILPLMYNKQQKEHVTLYHYILDMITGYMYTKFHYHGEIKSNLTGLT